MASDGPGPSRRILLADADAFYVQVARRADPDGAGREPLLIVGGSMEGRGVVTSASYEARAFGVRSAMPTAQALRLCPDAIVVPVPMEECAARSKEIQRVLEGFTPIVEPASIDEFYLDLGGTERLYAFDDLASVATRIRAAVEDATQLTISIGGGTSRLIAKLAAKRAKPHRDKANTGVCIVPPGKEAAFVGKLTLRDLPGVGPRFEERLAHYGLRTVEDILKREQGELREWFGDRAAAWLHRRARGIDETKVTPGADRKSVSHEETFSRDLTTDADLNDRLTRLALRVASDLRYKGLLARTVSVKLRDADFTTRQASFTLPRPIATDRPIVTTARNLLERLRDARRTPARLIGVSASHLHYDQDARQLDLWGADEQDELENAKDRAIARLLDSVTLRYGRSSLFRATQTKRTPSQP